MGYFQGWRRSDYQVNWRVRGYLLTGCLRERQGAYYSLGWRGSDYLLGIIGG